MYEVWLRPNLRAMRIGLIAPAVVAIVSMAAIFSRIGFLLVVGWIGIALSGLLVGLIAWLMAPAGVGVRHWLFAGEPPQRSADSHADRRGGVFSWAADR